MMVGIEDFRVVSPDAAITVEHRCQHGNSVAGLKLIFACQKALLIGIAIKHRRGWAEAKRLFDDLLDIDKLVNLFVCGSLPGISAQDAVHFFIGTIEYIRMV